MHCEKLEGWNTNNCCSTCHDDWLELDYEACFIEDLGLHVCCKAKEWYIKQHPESKSYKYLKEIGIL